MAFAFAKHRSLSTRSAIAVSDEVVAERGNFDQVDARTERKQIVAWLRERAGGYGHGERVFAYQNVSLIADAIERGDHLAS